MVFLRRRLLRLKPFTQEGGLPMLNKKNTDYFNKILLVAITLLLIEVTFFHSRVIFFGTFSIVCIYFGRKKLPSFFGKILFWLGCISLTITVMTMFTFKFIILAIIVYVFIQFVQSKQKPLHITPTILETPQENQMEPILKRKPLFENVLFGSKQTPDRVYEPSNRNRRYHY
jgi:lia operon protein LiaF